MIFADVIAWTLGIPVTLVSAWFFFYVPSIFFGYARDAWKQNDMDDCITWSFLGLFLILTGLVGLFGLYTVYHLYFGMV